ncbi:MAG: prefoldin subunit alpha [Sulfolobales archaeon]
MSSQKTPTDEQKIQALAIELSRVEEYLRALQQNLGILLQEIEEISIAREALEGLRKFQSNEILMGIDRRGHVYVKGMVASKDKVLAHIGGEYLAEVSIDEALKILDNKESDLRKSLEALNQEIVETSRLYERLQAALSNLLTERDKDKKE